MRRAASSMVLAVLLGMLSVAFVRAQGDGVPPELTRILRGLENEDWRARAVAFRSLIAYADSTARAGESWLIGSNLDRLFGRLPQTRGPVSDALVKTFRVENDFMKRAKSLGEDYLDYFPDLMIAVAALRDSRALPDLLDNVRSGAIATEGVAAFGAEALADVLKLTTASSEYTRSDGVRVLSAMLESKNAGRVRERERATIKTALVRAAADDSRWVRQAAIQGLARIPGDDVTALLRKMADSDPFVVSNTGQPPVYPVRREAALALLGRPNR